MTKIEVCFSFDSCEVRDVELVKITIGRFICDLIGHAEIVFTTEKGKKG